MAAFSAFTFDGYNVKIKNCSPEGSEMLRIWLFIAFLMSVPVASWADADPACGRTAMSDILKSDRDLLESTQPASEKQLVSITTHALVNNSILGICPGRGAGETVWFGWGFALSDRAQVRRAKLNGGKELSAPRLQTLYNSIEKTKLYFTNVLNSQVSGSIRAAAEDGLKFCGDTLSELRGMAPSDKVNLELGWDLVAARQSAISGAFQIAREYCETIRQKASKYEPDAFVDGMLEECYGFIAIWEKNQKEACVRYTKAAEYYRKVSAADAGGDEAKAFKRTRAEEGLNRVTNNLQKRCEGLDDNKTQGPAVVTAQRIGFLTFFYELANKRAEKRNQNEVGYLFGESCKQLQISCENSTPAMRMLGWTNHRTGEEENFLSFPPTSVNAKDKMLILRKAKLNRERVDYYLSSLSGVLTRAITCNEQKLSICKEIPAPQGQSGFSRELAFWKQLSKIPDIEKRFLNP